MDKKGQTLLPGCVQSLSMGRPRSLDLGLKAEGDPEGANSWRLSRDCTLCWEKAQPWAAGQGPPAGHPGL